jgi:RNase P subunit RPR2
MRDEKFGNYLQELYKGRRTKCRDCKKEGTVGVTLDIEHSEFIGPGVTEQSIWATCKECYEKRFPTNKR